MKKVLLFFLIVLSCVLLASCGDTRETVVLNVYNWGEYISDGSEGTDDVNAMFEEYFEENYAEEYGFSVSVN